MITDAEVEDNVHISDISVEHALLKMPSFKRLSLWSGVESGVLSVILIY